MKVKRIKLKHLAQYLTLWALSNQLQALAIIRGGPYPKDLGKWKQKIWEHQELEGFFFFFLTYEKFVLKTELNIQPRKFRIYIVTSRVLSNIEKWTNL